MTFCQTVENYTNPFPLVTSPWYSRVPGSTIHLCPWRLFQAFTGSGPEPCHCTQAYHCPFWNQGTVQAAVSASFISRAVGFQRQEDGFHLTSFLLSPAPSWQPDSPIAELLSVLGHARTENGLKIQWGPRRKYSQSVWSAPETTAGGKSSWYFQRLTVHRWLAGQFPMAKAIPGRTRHGYTVHRSGDHLCAFFAALHAVLFSRVLLKICFTPRLLTRLPFMDRVTSFPKLLGHAVGAVGQRDQNIMELELQALRGFCRLNDIMCMCRRLPSGSVSGQKGMGQDKDPVAYGSLRRCVTVMREHGAQ